MGLKQTQLGQWVDLENFFFWCIISFLHLGSIWLSISSVFFRCCFFALVSWLDHIFKSLIREATCGQCLLSANADTENSLCSSSILVSFTNLSFFSFFFFFFYFTLTKQRLPNEVYFATVGNLCGVNNVQLSVAWKKKLVI